MLKIKTLFFLLLIASQYGTSQVASFNYRSNLEGINSTWHAIVLPNTIFSKVNEDLSDIRVLGIKENGDTIEAPYIIKENTTEIENQIIYTDIINESQIGNRYYYTFENNEKSKINTVDLDFSIYNFDWYVRLEGSNNEKRWYTILKNERILSIKNESTNFKHTRLNFSTVNYQYLRMSFVSKVNPAFYRASFRQKTLNEGVLQKYTPASIKVNNKPENNETVIDINLNEKVPVSKIHVDILDEIDFYRPIEIQRLIDSVETPNGWRPYYEDLYEETISSLRTNTFNFDYRMTNSLQIIIYNHDNAGLSVGNINIEGNVIQLLARFTEAAEYYLYYGNKNAHSPHYDIGKFEQNIPNEISSLTVNEEEFIARKEEPLDNKNHVNQYWLWAIMGFIILIIGGFTIHMLKENTP